MLKPSNAKSRLLHIISDIASNPDDFVTNPGKDMTRNRKCSLESTIKFILSMNGHSLNTEIYNFFNHKKGAMPTKSAIVQQRHKINDKLLPSIFNRFNESIPFEKCYNGYHLLAIDGSDVNLVTNCDDNDYRVKMARSDNCYYQMHLNAVYDLLEKRYVDTVLQPRPKLHESKAAITMVKRNWIQGKSIYICDRGYSSYNLMYNINNCSQYYVIRTKSLFAASFARALGLSQDCEFDHQFPVEFVRRKNDCCTTGCDTVRKILARRSDFDPLPFESHGNYIMNIRVVCVRIKSTYEYIFTNLDSAEFSAKQIAELYHMRWDIESSFRSTKYPLCLTSFHSKIREFNIQEVYARLIMYNFTSLVKCYHDYQLNQTIKKKQRKHKVQVSFADSIPAIKDFFNNILSECKLKQILLSYITEVIPERSFPRKVRSQTRVTLNNRA